MKHTKDEILTVQELEMNGKIFRLEEYWEEDDAGFCCVDFVLAKHTRLTVRENPDAPVMKTFDLDSREYGISMERSGDILDVTWHPECDRTEHTLVDTGSLAVL